MLRSKTFCIKKDAVYDKPLTIAKEKGENCAGDIAISRGSISLRSGFAASGWSTVMLGEDYTPLI
jgi:hypothetical protein